LTNAIPLQQLLILLVSFVLLRGFLVIALPLLRFSKKEARQFTFADFQQVRQSPVAAL
jgi:hypothetical protein